MKALTHGRLHATSHTTGFGPRPLIRCNELGFHLSCTPGTLRAGDYTYEGEWFEDQMHGEGKFTYASGSSYQGQWQTNKYQGKGTYQFPDGKFYQVGGAAGNCGVCELTDGGRVVGQGVGKLRFGC